MLITYIRTEPLPFCKSCNQQMEYYVPGLPDEDHEHPRCAGKRAAQELMDRLDKRLQEAKSNAK